MSKVYVQDISAEDLFKWFHQSIGDSGGDGSACISCANPEETADLFIKWFGVNHNGRAFWHSRDEYVGGGARYVNYHDSNENYMFCDREIDIGHGDYTFVVKANCSFRHYGRQFDGIVKALPL